MSFQEFLSVVESPDLRQVAQHWNDARGGKKIPAWADIDPAAIARQLRIIWSWKYDRAADRFTGRLAGEEIDAVFGKSMRGADMKEFFKDRSYDVIFARNKKVVAIPCFAHGKGLVFIHAGRYGRGERIILPLADDGVHGDGIIGATVYRLTPPSAADESRDSKASGEDVTFHPL